MTSAGAGQRPVATTMTEAGKPNVMKIFPAFGATTAEGHGYGYFGGVTWGPDVVAFVKNPPSTALIARC